MLSGENLVACSCLCVRDGEQQRFGYRFRLEMSLAVVMA
jgi:hypothetical protein